MAQAHKSSAKKGQARKAGSAGKGGAKPVYNEKKAKAQAASSQQERILDERTRHDVIAVVLIVLAVALLAMAFAGSDGVVTGAMVYVLRRGLGLGMFVLPIMLIVLALTFLVRFERQRVPARVAIGFALLFIAFLSIAALVTPNAASDPNYLFIELYLVNHGGYIGAAIAWACLNLFGMTVSAIFMAGLIIVALVIIGLSFSSIIERLRARAAEEAELRAHAEAQAAAQAAEDPFAHLPRNDYVPPVTVDDAATVPVIPVQTNTATTHVLSNSPEAAAGKTRLFGKSGKGARSRSQGNHAASSEHTVFAATQSGNAASAAVSAVAQNDRTQAQTRTLGGTSAVSPQNSTTAAEASSTITRTLGPRPQNEVPLAGSAAVSAATAATKPARTSTQRTKQVPTSATPLPQEGFELPSMSILRTSAASAATGESLETLRKTAGLLQETLADFGVNATVVDWVAGPTVTLFKVDLPSGVRVSRVSNLTDDIALALASPGVRIFAPVPGTNYVGIEVPNQQRETVLLGDVLKDAPASGPLQIAIGKDVEGQSIISDLSKMPHLLIGGTTGSGKSVAINAMIMSILMCATPAEVRMIMIDPKRVEFTPYNGIPHLYVPVVTESREAASALSWAVAEMERRLKVFSGVGARNIGQYNAKAQAGVEVEGTTLAEIPYLVIVIDELADLMMNVGKEVEFSISRLAQLARAAGIHLIVATQRPSTNVVTGLIKANITNRIAFNVASGIDSRVILDTPGAENLIGLGDLLLSKPELAKPQRIQGCFVSEEEIGAVVEKLKAQGEPDYHNDILTTNLITLGGGGSEGSGSSSVSDDPLVWEAAEIVVNSGMGSTSNLQRRLSIGYSRAGRIMDLLEEKGIVGPPNGSKPREVLVSDVLELETLRAFEESD